MTPQERLREIEDWHREAVNEANYNSIDFLISRIHELEAQNQNLTYALLEICRQALTETETK